MEILSKLLNSRFYLFTATLLSLLITAIYYGMFLYFGTNIPYWDEYIITLGFLENFEKGETISDKLSLLHSLANEHRIVLYRLLLLIEKSVFGDIDFLRMMVIGNTGVLLLWGVLWKSIKIKRHKLVYFLPVTLLLIVAAWERSTWACSAFFNTYVILFAFCALYFLSKNGTKNRAVAIVFAVLATYSFGNGLFVFPIGFFMLWLKGRPKKAYIIWGLAFFVMCLFYFLSYTKGINKSASVLNTNPVLFIAYISAFFGAVFKYITPYLAPFAGFAILLVMLGSLIVHFKNREEHALLWSYAAFLLASVFVAAVSRSGLGMGQAISFRYELIPALTLAIMYLFFLKTAHRKQVLIFSLLLSGLLYASRLHLNIKECGYLKERLENGLILHEMGDPSSLSGTFQQRKQLGKILDRSTASGLYKSPIEKLTALPNYYEVSELPEPNKRIKSKLYINRESDNLYFIKGWAYINGMQTHDATVKVALHSTKDKVYIFETTPIINRYLTEQYGYGLYLDKAGFKIILDKEQLTMLPNGVCKVGLIIENGGSTFYKPLKNIEL